MSDGLRAVLAFGFGEVAKERWFVPSAAFDRSGEHFGQAPDAAG